MMDPASYDTFFRTIGRKDFATAAGERAEAYKKIASEIGKLVVPSPPMFAAFQQKIQPFGERRQRYHDATEGAKQQRGELWRQAKKKRRLQVPPKDPRDPDASAPEPGWKWDPHYFREGLPPLAGPRHEMPAKRVPAVADGITKTIKAKEAKIRRLEKEIDRAEREAKRREAKRKDGMPPIYELMEPVRRKTARLNGLHQEVREDKYRLPEIETYLRSQYDELPPKQKRRGWIRIDHYTGKRDKDGNAVITPDDPAVFHTQHYREWEISWWRYLRWPEARAFGCWHPALEIPEDPCEWLKRFEETSTGPVERPLPKLDDARRLERCYAVVASIYDSVTQDGEPLTAVWPEGLQDDVWRKLSVGREYGPTQQYINNALKRVKADLEKLNGAGSALAQAQQGEAGADEQEPSPQNGHNYCPVALQMQEIGVALGMRSKARSDEVKVLLKSTGIVIKTLSRKQHLIALDTLSPAYYARLAQYVKDTHGTNIRPDSTDSP